MRTVHSLTFAGSLLASCGARADPTDHDVKAQPGTGGDAVTTQRDSKPTNAATTRIRLLAGGVEALVRIDDTPAGRDFVASLPLTLTLTDYNSTEKVAMLPRKLTTRGSPAGMDPAIGDFTYYAPWGNLAIFYKDFTYSKGLVPLGRVESGLAGLAQLTGEVKVTIVAYPTLEYAH